MLFIFGTIFWLITYIEIIRMGIKEKTCAMPIWCISLNIAWEGLYSIVSFSKNSGFTLINRTAFIIWFLIDILILLVWFKYGKNTLSYNKKKYFYGYTIIVILTCILIQLSFYMDSNNAVYITSFLQNLLMSVLFLENILNTKSIKGQSLLMAISKCLGTIFFGLCYIDISNSYLNKYVVTITVLCFIFDLLYINLLHKGT